MQTLGAQCLGPLFLQGSGLGCLTAPSLLSLLSSSQRVLIPLSLPPPGSPSALSSCCTILGLSLPFKFVKQTYLNFHWSINLHKVPNPKRPTLRNCVRVYTHGITTRSNTERFQQPEISLVCSLEVPSLACLPACLHSSVRFLLTRHCFCEIHPWGCVSPSGSPLVLAEQYSL